MTLDKIDVDGMHDFIVISQRCNGTLQDLVLIHLSNLGRIKYDFADKSWYDFLSEQAFSGVVNHQMFQTPEMLRNDPTWRMLGQLMLTMDNEGY